MNYCPNCSYLLDINKEEASKKDSGKIIDSLEQLFLLLSNKTDIVNYTITISKESIVKSKKYNKLTNDQKHSIDQLYENINYTVRFICNNCTYNKKIDKSVMLYKLILYDNEEIIVKSEEEILLMKHDILLPHITDYTCPNSNCKTNKENIIKDALFYKDNNSYKMRYLCCVCDTIFTY